MNLTLPLSRRAINIFLIVSAITFLAYSVSFALVLPLERLATGRPELQAIVVYLPHGVKIIAAWMLGWWSLPFLLPVVILSNIVFVGDGALNTTDLALSVLTLVTAPLAFELFRLAGLDLGSLSGRRVRWRALPLVGFVASVMNVVPVFVLAAGSAELSAVFSSMASFVLGDTLGVIVALLIAMLAFRWCRRRHAH
jgi:hypothetical protein